MTIASHPEYRAWVEGYGIGYREIGGDPAALMKLSVEHKMVSRSAPARFCPPLTPFCSQFSPGFFRESLGHFRHWLDTLVRCLQLSHTPTQLTRVLPVRGVLGCSPGSRCPH